jgi:hypothetical protein
MKKQNFGFFKSAILCFFKWKYVEQ